MSDSLIIPNWPAPSNVRALSTTRLGGVSLAPWTSLNLGQHVGDLSSHVDGNRQRLQEIGALPSAPYWLNQIHSTRVVEVDSSTQMPAADASFTRHKEQLCTIMTADCLPVLFCHKDGQQVAAAHAGWRGLCNGIIENTLATFSCPMSEILVWLGPAIGPKAFEVGAEVRDAFLQHQPEAEHCFIKHHDKYLADLAGLAALRLQRARVSAISYSSRCTYSEPETFFSYRRDGQTGRQASLIWICE